MVRVGIKRCLMNRKIIWWLFTIGFISIIVFSLTLIKSPNEARTLRADHETFNKAYRISNEIINFYRKEDKLPATLAYLKSINMVELTLPNSKNSYSDEADHYEYNIITYNSFEICFIFRASYNTREEYSLGLSSIYASNFLNTDLPLAAGRNCFKYEYDDEEEVFDKVN